MKEPREDEVGMKHEVWRDIQPSMRIPDLKLAAGLCWEKNVELFGLSPPWTLGRRGERSGPPPEAGLSLPGVILDSASVWEFNGQFQLPLRELRQKEQVRRERRKQQVLASSGLLQIVKSQLLGVSDGQKFSSAPSFG